MLTRGLAGECRLAFRRDTVSVGAGNSAGGKGTTQLCVMERKTGGCKLSCATYTAVNLPFAVPVGLLRLRTAALVGAPPVAQGR